MTSTDRRRWTAAEDATLQRAYKVEAARPTGKGNAINWIEIAKELPGRSNKDCRKRFLNELASAIKKGPWTPEEDCRLQSLVQKHGFSWVIIAQGMKSRSADQCSKRWNNSLNPELERSPWTREECQILRRAVKTHNNRWKEIKKSHFPSRSSNDVKNQHIILSRRGETGSNLGPCCQGNSFEDLSHDSSKEMGTSSDSGVASPETEWLSSFAATTGDDQMSWLATGDDLIQTDLLLDSPNGLHGQQDPMFGFPLDAKMEAELARFSQPQPNAMGTLAITTDAASSTTNSDWTPSGRSDRSIQSQIQSMPRPATQAVTQAGNDVTQEARSMELGMWNSSAPMTVQERETTARSRGSEVQSLGSATPDLKGDRLTLHIEEADDQTLMKIMGILVDCRARVEFLRS